MKVITKALSENRSIGPHPGWWGIVKGNVRFLMRYHHLMLAIYADKDILYAMPKNECTRTDLAGLKDAWKQIQSKDYKVI